MRIRKNLLLYDQLYLILYIILYSYKDMIYYIINIIKSYISLNGWL
jgi:hypothetical protein